MNTSMTLRRCMARALITSLIALQLPLAVAASTQTQATSSEPEPVCPSQDFDRFAQRFANDIDVQKSFVSTPLQNTFIDPEAQPEPRQVSQRLEKAQLNFPLMPDDQQQHAQGLTLTKQLTGTDRAMIKLTKADTDYQRSLFFKREACWLLYRIQDDSL
ncbi:hypothetical protein PS3A_57690 [Pseudomonas sp. 3A(2025)]